MFFKPGKRFRAHAQVIGNMAVGDLLEQPGASLQQSLVPLYRGTGKDIFFPFQQLQHQFFEERQPNLKLFRVLPDKPV